MTIYFCNAEPIDLNAIAIMGVSVKTGDNPIGFFGTGLKFSIATLLRTGHRVRLIRNGETIQFAAEPETIRGEEFERVRMGNERLGFTTRLGRTWEPWQAYRELYCNCLDEGGVIGDEMPDGDWGTVFAVEGEPIAQCHRNRHDIFLSSKPLSKGWACEIHPGEGMHAFYRGVRAHKHGQVSLFTYNVTTSIDLTEDRTIKNPFMLECYAEQAVASSDDEDLIHKAIMAPKGTFENSFDYAACDKPSLAFMDVAFRLRTNGHANQAAIKLWEKHADIRLTYDEVETDPFEEEVIKAAISLVRRLGVALERRDFMVVDGLGEGIFGTVRNQRILIAKRTLDLGPRFTASTLYEEWLHKTEGLVDQSRDLQNLLFEKLFAMVERLSAIETQPRRRAALPDAEQGGGK